MTETEPNQSPTVVEQISPYSTLIRFLCGRREAILECWQMPRAWLWGLILVLTAGLAREYDAEYLWAEPWHLFLPIGASLVTSFVLYLLIFMPAATMGEKFSFWSNYRRFLSLYWLTAPLAWCYAIPVERFLTSYDAIVANLWLLLLVSVWRVVLIIKIINVVFSTTTLKATFAVMLFADTVMLILLFYAKLPIIQIMGGIHLSDSESLLLSVRMNLLLIGICSWPIWLIGYMSINIQSKYKYVAAPVVLSVQSSIKNYLWPALMTLLLMSQLPQTQSEQYHRYQFEQALRNSEFKRAISELQKHERSDYPPLWDPPPRPGYGESSPNLLAIISELPILSNGHWMREIYLNKLKQYQGYYGLIHDLTPDQKTEHLQAIIKMPEFEAWYRHEDIPLNKDPSIVEEESLKND